MMVREWPFNSCDISRAGAITRDNFIGSILVTIDGNGWQCSMG